MGKHSRRTRRKRTKTKRVRNKSTPARPHSIRVLANPTPRHLQLRGAIIDVEWSVPEARAKALTDEGRSIPAPIMGPVLVDTGATQTAIADEVAIELGLQPSGQRSTGGVHGNLPANLYYVTIAIATLGAQTLHRTAELVGVPDLRKITYDLIDSNTKKPRGLTGLIGRDFLQHCRMVYNGHTGQVTITVAE